MCVFRCRCRCRCARVFASPSGCALFHSLVCWNSHPPPRWVVQPGLEYIPLSIPLLMAGGHRAPWPSNEDLITSRNSGIQHKIGHLWSILTLDAAVLSNISKNGIPTNLVLKFSQCSVHSLVICSLHLYPQFSFVVQKSSLWCHVA